MDWGKIISTGVSLVGAMKSKKAEGNIAGAYEAGLNALQSLVPPTVADLSVKLEDYVQQGQITPEEYIAYLQKQSELEGVKIPDQVLNAQYDVLTHLQDITNSGGLTAVDKAKINDIRDQVMQKTSSNNMATQQNFASRGLSGSGLEVASRLANDSAATQAASKQGFDVAALAEQRALDALSAQGTQANAMRGQEYTQQSDLAKANDAINRFNTSAKQSVSDKNIADANEAQATNLAAKQAIADKNTGVANTEETANKAAVQTAWNDQYNRANAMTGAGSTAGNAMTNAAARDENFYGNLGSAAGSIFSAYGKKKKTTGDDTSSTSSSTPDYSNVDYGFKDTGDYSASDKRVKTNIKDLDDEDICAILDHMTGKKYKYAKDFKDDGKVHFGVLAQDVEKTPAGAALVVEKNGVKHIDNGEASMVALAALANLNKRMKKMEGK